MVCRQCGAQVPDGSAFCPSCGTAVAATPEAGRETPQPATVSQAEPPASGGQGSGGPIAAAGGATSQVAEPRMYSLPVVESIARQRLETDERLTFSSYLAWTILPALTVIGIVVSIVAAYVYQFKLLERRNRHFRRQQEFMRAVVRCLRERFPAETSGPAAGAVGRLELLIGEAEGRETEHSPWLWAVILPIVTLGLASLVTWYWLTCDFGRHSLRQREIMDALNEVFRQLGLRAAAIVDDSAVPRRNYWAYLLLYIFTAGLGGLWWLYIMMKDGNDHFARQAMVEDQVLSVLRSVA